MSLSILNLRLPFLSLLAIFTLLACEGGKNNNACYPGSNEPNCKATNTPTQCPSGQVRINGVCQVSKPFCAGNEVLENGVCVSACPALQHREQGVCVNDDITIEIVNKEACTIGANGYARITMQFIARDDSGFAVDPGLNSQNLQSDILKDGKPNNSEFLINRESKLLQSDMVLSLVLDNSGSMLEHPDIVLDQTNISAIKQMKASAVSILRETKEKWKDNNSNFDWRLLWFNDYLNKPATNLAGESWSIEDIKSIPEPLPNDGTELYKAISYAISDHEKLYNTGKAASARDQHVMIVFSDGVDTHSHVNNSGYLKQKNINDTLFWTEFGAPAADKNTLIERLTAIQANANTGMNLRVHVIGFGKDANAGFELEEIASAGNGRYFYGSSTDALGQLFKDVQREFITIQTISITASLPEGSYEFSIQAKHLVTLAEGTSDEAFTVEIGPGLSPCK